MVIRCFAAQASRLAIPYLSDSDGEASYEVAPPLAGALIELLRGFGYSAATALADLVDNSISAGAKSVWLNFHFAGQSSFITLLDNGRGMPCEELRRAMTLGGVGPLTTRRADDLGRFGLGLKTASFSQCRCLTVSSKNASQVHTRRWDLDYIARPDVADWRLLSAPRIGSESLLGTLERVENGTLVIWDGLDRIVGNAEAQNQAAGNAFYDLAERIGKHLSMVFHRYIEGQFPDLRILVGGHRIQPWDPFLRSKLATFATPVETIHRANGAVELEGFVLPHKDQLGPDYEQAGGMEGWTAQQGFTCTETAACWSPETGSGSDRRASGRWRSLTSSPGFGSNSRTAPITNGISTSRSRWRGRHAGCGSG